MNPGYKIEQGILWPVIIVGLTLSSYQLYLARLLPSTSTSKRNIQITLCIELILWIPHLIDPYGLNGYIPIWSDQFFSDCATLAAVIALEFILYSHFQAHYGALKKEIPYYIPLVLQVAAGGQFLCLFLTDTLVFLGLQTAMNLIAWSTVVFLLTLLVLDVGSFIVMYRLMMDMLRTKDMPHRCGEDVFRGLLQRMKRFHGLVVPMLFFAFTFYTSQASVNAKNPVILRPKSPNDFVLSGSIPACLSMYFICTWWAWIPHSASESHHRPSKNGNEHKRTTQEAHTHTHTPPKQSENVEIAPLPTPTPATEDTSPDPLPSLRSVSQLSPQSSLSPQLQSHGSEERELSQAETETPLLNHLDRRTTAEEESGREIFNPHLSPSFEEKKEEHPAEIV